MDEESLPDWERLLSAERHLQALVPGTVLVGGTAAALHAQHRISFDGRLDGVLTGIRRLRRIRPLETEEIAGLRVPTLTEMARADIGRRCSPNYFSNATRTRDEPI